MFKPREEFTQEDKDWNAKNNPSVQLTWIRESLLKSNKLSTWELNFLYSIRYSIEKGHTLMEPQITFLEKIYNKI